MKKVCLILAVVMMGFVSLVAAQKPFAGTIKIHSHIEGTDDPNILSQGESDESVLIFGNCTKVVATMGGGLGQIVITNGDAKNLIQIIDLSAMGMGKYYMEVNADQLAEKMKNIKMDYNYTGEKKNIANYDCEKVVVTVTDLETDESEDLTLYVSTAINAGDAINFYQYPGLKGYPLRTEVKHDIDGTEISIIEEATEVIPSKKVKMVDFMRPSDVQDLKEHPEVLKMLGFGSGDEDDE